MFYFFGDFGTNDYSGQDGISTLGLWAAFVCERGGVFGKDIFCAILEFWRGHRLGNKWDQGYQFE